MTAIVTGRARRVTARLLPLALVPTGLLLSAEPALAGCHAFEIAVSPAVVTEGGSVTVTVTRDNQAAPSSVDVTSIDGTAKASQDYVAVSRTVAFASGTSQTFPVATKNDTADEPDETFKLNLSNGAGCAVNPNFTYGGNAVVTVRDNDAAPATTRPPTTPPARTTAPAATRSADTSQPPETTPPAGTTAATVPTAPGATTLEPGPSFDALPSAAPASADGGLSGGAVAAIVAVALAALAGAGVLWWRRRPTSV